MGCAPFFCQKFARVPKDDVLFDENPTRFSLEHFRESLRNLKNPLCGCPQMLCRPKNSGVRTQFLKRMIEFSDWSGFEVHLVYYPPYHSKYKPIQRCWSSLHQKCNGVLLKCWDVVQACALRMTWKQQHPNVFKNHNDYPTGVIVPSQEMMQLNKPLQRSDSLRKYDILITPKTTRGR